MANHVIPENPQISLELQKLRTTDRAHADIFNNINAKLIENDAYLEKEIREAAKEGIQLTTDREFVNSLISNTAKAGSVLLFSNIGERYGNVTDESYTLYAGLMNCNRYSNCDITVKPVNSEIEQSLHPMYFQAPAYFIAKVDKQNAKKVVIYPVSSGDTDEIKSRLDNVEAKANQAFTQAHEGKRKLADALVSKGQVISNTASFQEMAQKIREISTISYIKIRDIVSAGADIHRVCSYVSNDSAEIYLYNDSVKMKVAHPKDEYITHSLFIFKNSITIKNKKNIYIDCSDAPRKLSNNVTADAYYLLPKTTNINTISPNFVINNGIKLFQNREISNLSGEYYLAYLGSTYSRDGSYKNSYYTSIYGIFLY